MDLPFKSLWRRRYSHVWSFFCPLCRTPRRVPFRSRPGGVLQFSQIGLTSIMFTLLFWNHLGFKGLVSFVPFWTVFEVVYRWRMRAALGCVQCGFDPYLFSVDVKRAKTEVEAHWRKKFAEKGIPYPEV